MTLNDLKGKGIKKAVIIMVDLDSTIIDTSQTIINLYNWWNKVVTKNNRQSKLFINTDTLFFDIERYF